MFETWRKVAEQIWQQVEDKGDTNAQTIAYQCGKKGIAPQSEIWKLVANVDGNVKQHAVDLKTEWMRRQEIGIHESSLAELQAGEDPESIVLKAEAERELFTGFSDNKDQTRVQKCNGFLDRVLSAKNGTAPVGYSTGLISIDRLVGGMGIPNRFRVWAARPGMGKSTFAQRVAEQIARNGCPTAFFMLEMIFDQAAEKFVQGQTGISRTDIQQGKITDDDYKTVQAAIEDLHDLPIYFEDDISDVNRMVGRIRQYKRKYGVKQVFIDYLQLMCDNSKRFRQKDEEVEEISKKLATLARTEKIDIVALSQLSRAVETRGGDKRPQMSDLRRSGAIEQDAGQIMFFYRPDYYQILEDEEGQSLIGIVECIQDKDRYSGRIGTAKVSYVSSKDKYKECNDDDKEDIPDYDPQIKPSRSTGIGDDIPF